VNPAIVANSTLGSLEIYSALERLDLASVRGRRDSGHSAVTETAGAFSRILVSGENQRFIGAVSSVKDRTLLQLLTEIRTASVT
jgi:hypothetical protein